MLNMDLYAIITPSDIGTYYREFFLSFEEAKEGCSKYLLEGRNDEYLVITICKYKANEYFQPCHMWLLDRDGEIFSEFDETCFEDGRLIRKKGKKGKKRKG